MNWQDIDNYTRERFDHLCEEHEWTPVFEQEGDRCVIAFISPEPDLEWKVAGDTFEECIKKSIGDK